MRGKVTCPKACSQATSQTSARRLRREVFSPGTPVLPSPQKRTFKLSLRSGKCVELVGDTLTRRKVYLTLELSSATLSGIKLV